METTAETINISKIFRIVWSNIYYIIIVTLLFALLGLFTAYIIPHKYKSKTTLNIQASYFQHPLVSDLLSDVSDPSELNAQRLALLRLALSTEFLDTLGQKYQLFSHAGSNTQHAIDRELFLKKIEYFSVSPTSFQISVVADTALKSYHMAQDILAQMTNTLIEQRYQSLMRARSAILKQTKLLNSTMSNSGALVQRANLDLQLNKMEGSLAALKSRLADTHPQVQALKSRTAALRAQVSHLPDQASETIDDYTRVFLNPSSRTSTQEIYDDLLKKLSYLNIVLEMEQDRESVSYLTVIEQPTLPFTPFFPNSKEFVLLGALFGMLLTLIRITYNELKRSNELTPHEAAEIFKLEFLGELPPLLEKNRILLLEILPKSVVALPLTLRET